eukprot:TRINITY_DN33603_c0_g1_i4.p1 TRINITY_DN33603_c0_g1~~TRINITY_DN33603_c0_g1_i4.p1  ORF type:complete len:186 (-),score=27.98 TRINITY_DN33603_c0_g1_i4:61-618(-)
MQCLHVTSTRQLARVTNHRFSVVQAQLIPCRADVSVVAATSSSTSRCYGSERQKKPDLYHKPYSERGYISRDAPRKYKYWPPNPEQEEDAEAPIPLPGGRKNVTVCSSKRDVDGYLEAQVVITTRGGHRLFHLNEEEIQELEKLAPRLTEYLDLWEEKALLDQEQATEEALKPQLDEQARRQLWE